MIKRTKMITNDSKQEAIFEYHATGVARFIVNISQYGNLQVSAEYETGDGKVRKDGIFVCPINKSAVELVVL